MNTKTPKASTKKISPKDIVIMQLIAIGHRTSQIVEKVGLTERTIEGRMARLKKKLGCKTITRVAITLLKANIIK